MVEIMCNFEVSIVPAEGLVPLGILMSRWIRNHKSKLNDTIYSDSHNVNDDLVAVVSMNKLLNKRSRCRWNGIQRYSSDVAVMKKINVDQDELKDHI